MLDADRRELRRGGAIVPVEPQVFDLLAYLVCHRDRVVTKDDLLTAVWNGRIVSESALTTRINAARAALGDSGAAQRVVRTLRGRGFRFVGTVHESEESSAHATAPELLPPSLPDRPSIAVLPFANMSGDQEQEYFADGMVDDILQALSRVRWLFVIARQSSFCYKGRAVDVKQIGRELGVRYLVEGSVRRAGDRVRIAVQLIDAEADAHLWAERYERDLSDIFALQDEITARIVAAVEPNVQAVEIQRARAKPPGSLAAYDLYLRALWTYHGQTAIEYNSEGGYNRAEALLREAIALDPGYAEALGMLTDRIVIRTLNGWHESFARGADEACQFARRALAAGPDNSTCVASAAFAYAALAHRFDEALDLAGRALALHPNSAFVRHRAGAVYIVCGEFDAAIAQCEAVLRMNPLETMSVAMSSFTVLSAALFFVRRFEESIQAGKRVLAITPAVNTVRKYVAASLAHLGRIDEARAEVSELMRHQPNASCRFFRGQPCRHDWMRELVLEGLRKAGLPEE